MKPFIEYSIPVFNLELDLELIEPIIIGDFILLKETNHFDNPLVKINKHSCETLYSGMFSSNYTLFYKSKRLLSDLEIRKITDICINYLRILSNSTVGIKFIRRSDNYIYFMRSNNIIVKNGYRLKSKLIDGILKYDDFVNNYDLLWNAFDIYNKSFYESEYSYTIVDMVIALERLLIPEKDDKKNRFVERCYYFSKLLYKKKKSITKNMIEYYYSQIRCEYSHSGKDILEREKEIKYSDINYLRELFRRLIIYFINNGYCENEQKERLLKSVYR